ncbi:LLM class flavin-dependent oxidoreductase [Massilia sp. CT11-108]|uniref:LLM class flavin-dependent oxidoreductase n=1 Tax=Massilia sp. CT11-108 TaxID=3393900 RepID=UPI0039A43F32
MTHLQLSILERPVSIGSEGQAITELISIAQLADRLGYKRCWLTEHHSCLLDSSPEIILPLLAATTRQIKVGTAGILLRYYSPYKVATTFQLLNTMFPGRIDLGVCAGQVAGTALEGLSSGDVLGFDEKNEQLRGYLQFNHERLSAFEWAESQPNYWIHGTGRGSMSLAIRLRASYCYSLCHHTSNADPLVLAEYRSQIEDHTNPSVIPDCAVLVAGICASTDAEALEMLAGYNNAFITPTMAGSASTCAAELHRLARTYNVSNIVWWDLSPTHEQRAQSLTLLSKVSGLDQLDSRRE